MNALDPRNALLQQYMRRAAITDAVWEQLPRDIRDKLNIDVKGDAFGLVTKVIFIDFDKRAYECTLEPGCKVPDIMLAQLSLMVK